MPQRSTPRHQARRPSGIGIGVVLVLLATGCTFGADRAGFSPQEVEITLREYTFDIEEPVRPGRVVFRVSNQGKLDHDLALVELPADVATVDELVDSDRPGVAPVYTMATRAPGDVGLFAVDLPEGRYALLGFESGQDGTPHYRNGMVADLEVGDP